jgi:hypothetical protein
VLSGLCYLLGSLHGPPKAKMNRIAKMYLVASGSLRPTLPCCQPLLRRCKQAAVPSHIREDQRHPEPFPILCAKAHIFLVNGLQTTYWVCSIEMSESVASLQLCALSVATATRVHSYFTGGVSYGGFRDEACMKQRREKRLQTQLCPGST